MTTDYTALREAAERLILANASEQYAKQYLVVPNPQTIISLLDELTALRANQRTVGMVEKCRYHNFSDCAEFYQNAGQSLVRCLREDDCPLRTPQVKP